MISRHEKKQENGITAIYRVQYISWVICHWVGIMEKLKCNLGGLINPLVVDEKPHVQETNWPIYYLIGF